MVLYDRSVRCIEILFENGYLTAKLLKVVYLYFLIYLGYMHV